MPVTNFPDGISSLGQDITANGLFVNRSLTTSGDGGATLGYGVTAIKTDDGGAGFILPPAIPNTMVMLIPYLQDGTVSALILSPQDGESINGGGGGFATTGGSLNVPPTVLVCYTAGLWEGNVNND